MARQRRLHAELDKEFGNPNTLNSDSINFLNEKGRNPTADAKRHHLATNEPLTGGYGHEVEKYILGEGVAVDRNRKHDHRPDLKDYEELDAEVPHAEKHKGRPETILEGGGPEIQNMKSEGAPRQK